MLTTHNGNSAPISVNYCLPDWVMGTVHVTTLTVVTILTPV